MSSRCMMGRRRRRRFFQSRLFRPRHGRSRCVNHQSDRLNRRRVMAPPLRRCPHMSREFITIRRLHRCVQGVYKSPSMSFTVSLLYGSPGHFSRHVQVHFHNYCSCGARGGKMWRQHEREALIKLLISSQRSDLLRENLDFHIINKHPSSHQRSA